MTDFARIKANVELMASKGAPPEHINDYLRQEGYTADKFKARVQGMGDAGVADTALKYSAGSGVANLLDLPGNTLTSAYNLMQMGRGVATSKPQDYPITDPDTLSFAKRWFKRNGLIDDAYAPTTAGGKVADFATQAVAGGGINPAAVARNAVRGVVKPIVRDVAAASASGAGAGLGNVLTENLDTGDPTFDNAAKIAATLLGGATPGGLIAARGTAGDRAAAATKSVTQEQMALARELKRKAASSGSPITDYEAIQAVTGLNPKMQTQQRLAEQSDAAASTLTPIMQNRPNANSIMFNKTANSISPVEQYPDTLAGLLQQAAKDSLQKAKEFRTAAASPDYRAQRTSDAEAMGLQDKIPRLENKVNDRLASRADAVQLGGKMSALENEMTNISNNYYPVPGMPRFPARYTHQAERAAEAADVVPEAQAIAQWRLKEANDLQQKLNETADALAAKNLPYIQGKVSGFIGQLDNDIKLAGPTTEAKILQSFRDEIAPGGNPIVYPSQLESVYKANRNKLDLGLAPTDIQKTQAGVIGPYVRNLDSLIQEVSPAIKQGRQIYAQVSRDVVNPMDASQVGKLARSDDFKQQSETFLPNQPADVTPSVIERTANTIGEQDPDIIKRFLAQDLRRKFDEANQANMGGENAFGGAKFAAQVAGNPIQEANLIAAIKASGAPTAPFNDSLDIFRAQGYKPPVNSATVANAEEASKLGGVLGALTKPFKAIPVAVDSWRNGMATSDLAKALSAQDSSGPLRIEELARINGVHDPMKQQMLINLLLSNPQANQ